MPARRSRRWSCAPRIAASHGFTLIELLVVMLVIVILAASAGPSFLATLVAQRVRAAGTDLVSSLMLARSEAIKRNANVTIQPLTAADWTSGWIVQSAAGDQLDRKDVIGAHVAVTLGPNAIVYNGSGRINAVGAVRLQFADATGTAGVMPRCVSIDTSGVPKLAATVCP